MNRRNQRKQRMLEKKLNNMIRQLCCWNCFQVGHKRFQCPFIKTPSCSFCRKPSVLSVNCGCELSTTYNGLHNHRRIVNNAVVPNYEENVIVPVVDNQNGAIQYREDDNLVIFINNQDEQNETQEAVDEDILEIHADKESLEDL